jgi:hypothetical protein
LLRARIGIGSLGLSVDSSSTTVTIASRGSLVKSVVGIVEVFVVTTVVPANSLLASALGSPLFSWSLLRIAIREIVELIRFSPEELAGLLLLPGANFEAALEILCTVVSSTGVAGVDVASGARKLLAVLPTLVSVYAMLPRRSSGKLILCLGLSISAESLKVGVESSLILGK